jgi:hypothetical protein
VTVELLKSLISQYKETESSMSEKQKAELEQQLWNIIQGLPEERAGFRSKRDWAAAKLGGSSRDYEQRSALIMAGPWVNPLWEMLENKVARHAVQLIFREAKARVARASNRLSQDEALRQVIDEYNARENTATTKDGRTFRRQAPTRPPPPPVDSVMTEMDMDSPQGQRSKVFLGKMTALTDEFIRTSLLELSHVEEMTVKLAKDELVSFIREACDDFRRRVYSLRSASKKERERLSRITRDELRGAAEVLGIPVVWDKDVDLRLAKKIMLRRCAQLHPDKVGPMSDNQKAEYNAVIESYKTLERYMESRKPNAVGERSSHEG